jgi:hypothetical protein
MNWHFRKFRSRVCPHKDCTTEFALNVMVSAAFRPVVFVKLHARGGHIDALRCVRSRCQVGEDNFGAPSRSRIFLRCGARGRRKTSNIFSISGGQRRWRNRCALSPEDVNYLFRIERPAEGAAIVIPCRTRCQSIFSTPLLSPCRPWTTRGSTASQSQDRAAAKPMLPGISGSGPRRRPDSRPSFT